MPLGLGTPEILIILAIALLILGPTKLPQLARALGESIREFRKASSGVLEEEEKNVVKQLQKEVSSDIDDETLKKIAEKLGVSVEGKCSEELKKEVVEKAKEKKVV